ncbi:ras-related protein Rab-28-like [Sitophilus oryzae]|uniref:Ras-related protein Rab-28-like n=1 Tax=Sitophilus oryzae TaxID=7048 RepID=A0A6J2YJ98_SITOR|nr:ras-related protein Rab-28-like [Sitophilus oryzae]
MSDSEDDFNNNQIKVVVLGEQNVGKTNIIKRYCYDDFSRIYVPTVGADFFIKRTSLSKNKEITVRFTDVSGLELAGHMLKTYLFQVNIVILVYDITEYKSFDSLAIWLRVVDQIIENNTESQKLIAVFGNKCDLEHKRSVRLDKTNHFINEHQLVNYFVSAKTGENINSAFTELLARYFNVPLTRLEKEKQKMVMKAELIPNTPVISTKNGCSKMKMKNNVNTVKNKNKKNNAVRSENSCTVQ